jgi:hypothetical protein
MGLAALGVFALVAGVVVLNNNGGGENDPDKKPREDGEGGERSEPQKKPLNRRVHREDL